MFISLIGVVLAGTAAANPTALPSSNPNWCGSIATATGIETVEATWIVPTISIPSTAGAKLHYSAYQWIGMGGTPACSKSQDLFQAGSGMEIVNGVAKYYPYYELFPRGPQSNADLTLSAGDEVYCKLTVTSSTTGTIYWENLTTGKSDTKYLTSDKGRTICQKTVEWIHERPGNRDGSFRPFPDFTTFSFTGIAANTSDGTAINLAGAQDEILKDKATGSKLCHPTRDGDTDLTLSQDNEWSG